MNIVLGLMVVLGMVAGLGVAMTNEVSISASLQAAKSGASVNVALSALDDLGGSVIFSNTQSIGTSTEAIDFGETPPTLNWVFLKNVDPTNYVDIGINTPLTQKFAKLKPGKGCLFPVATGAVYYGLANTAPVLLQVVGVEA